MEAVTRRRVTGTGLAAFALSSLVVVRADAAPRVRYDGHAIARVTAPDHVPLEAFVETLEGMGLESLADRPSDRLMVRVPPHARPSLDAAGFAYEIVEPDLQASLDAEALRVATRPAAEDAYFDDFRPLDEVYARLDALEATGSDVTAIEVGTSLEGRPIRGLRFERDPTTPVVLINACQHAREWLSVTTAMGIAEALATRDSAPIDDTSFADPDAAAQLDALLDEVSFIIVPVVNPDGYVFTWDDDRLWRKNRQSEHGVDLNRNWATAWGGPGSNDNAQSNNYRGESAFSEPETAALRDLMLAEERLVAHVDLHTYGQLVLYPWGWSDAVSPDDDVLAPLAEDVATTITAAFGVEYEPRRAGSWYAASGNLMDWSYGELGLRALTIELRPDEDIDHAVGFIPSAAQIRPTADEAILAVLALARWTAGAPELEPGDDGDAPIPEDEPEDDGEPEVPTGDGTGSEDGTTGTLAPPDEPDAGETGSDPPANGDDGSGEGCACRTSSRPSSIGMWALVALFVRRRRRGRPSARASRLVRVSHWRWS